MIGWWKTRTRRALGPTGHGRAGRAGRGLPDDVVVAVGGVDRSWGLGACGFVVTVLGSGPVRVHYSIEEPFGGPLWLSQITVPEGERARVLRAVLDSGALDQAAQAEVRGDSADGADFWVHVRAGGRSVWLPLPGDRQINGVPVWELVIGLVPERTWTGMYRRRLAAYAEWQRRHHTHSVRIPRQRSGGTRPRPGGGGGVVPWLEHADYPGPDTMSIPTIPDSALGDTPDESPGGGAGDLDGAGGGLGEACGGVG